ncbi:MAG: hypothetical protein GX111_00175 [Clostridiales bacterium]|nr:hypothetical protein [Clostridiales bacterium]
MSNLAATLDLKKLPFSRAKSSYYLFEENNRDGTNFEPGIYFGMSYPNGATRREGLVRIVPVSDGKPLNYAYNCSPGRLEITSDCGSVTIVMDSTASMRMYGSGIGIMIHKEMPVMSMETVTEVRPNVVEFNLFSPTGGGGRFVFSCVSGVVNLENKAVLTADGVNRCTIWLLPGEDGCFETQVNPAIPQESEVFSKPLNEAVGEVEQAFEAYLSAYAEVPDKWQALKETCAYMCWINYREANPGEMAPVMLADMFCASRISDMQCYAWHQPFFGMAFSDGDSALGAITNVFSSLKNGMLPAAVCSGQLRYGSFPFYHGYALTKTLDRCGNDLLPEDKAAALYEKMKENYTWWKDSHSFLPGRISYSYPAECGFPASSLTALEFPLEAPDFYAQMILYSEVIGRVERLAGKGNGLFWYEESQALKKTLTGELWDGERFICRGVISGKTFPCDSLLAYVPVILGKRLPEDILDKLSEALGCEKRFLGPRGLVSENMTSRYYDAKIPGCGTVEMILQQLFVLGLLDSGKAELAVKIAERVLNWTDKNAAVSSIPPEGGISSEKRPADVYEAVAASAVIALAAGLPM